jgi:hypothetical protein
MLSSGYVRSQTHDPRTASFFVEDGDSSSGSMVKPPVRKSFSNPNLTKQLQTAAAGTISCTSGNSAVAAAAAAARSADGPRRRSLDMPGNGFARARASLDLFPTGLAPMRRSASTAGGPAAAAAAGAGVQSGDAADNNRRDSGEGSGSQDPGVMAECFKIVPGAPGDNAAAESITMIKYTALRQQVGNPTCAVWLHLPESACIHRAVLQVCRSLRCPAHPVPQC